MGELVEVLLGEELLGSLVGRIILGAGAALAVGAVLARRGARPVATGVVGASMAAGERGRGVATAARAGMQDIVAEARTERRRARAAAPRKSQIPVEGSPTTPTA